VRSVLALLAAMPVRAMAHITGGGITENLARVLPEGCRAVIHRKSWEVPPVFALIRDGGRVSDDEMRRTFNMGVGFVVVMGAEDAELAGQVLRESGERVFEIGEVVAGARGTEYV
jgi:phosphoribosylformylglycinamidine cyclo-ligase